MYRLVDALLSCLSLLSENSKDTKDVGEGPRAFRNSNEASKPKLVDPSLRHSVCLTARKALVQRSDLLSSLRYFVETPLCTQTPRPCSTLCVANAMSQRDLRLAGKALNPSKEPRKEPQKEPREVR